MSKQITPTTRKGNIYLVFISVFVLIALSVVEIGEYLSVLIAFVAITTFVVGVLGAIRYWKVIDQLSVKKSEQSSQKSVLSKDISKMLFTNTFSRYLLLAFAIFLSASNNWRIVSDVLRVDLFDPIKLLGAILGANIWIILWLYYWRKYRKDF